MWRAVLPVQPERKVYCNARIYWSSLQFRGAASSSPLGLHLSLLQQQPAIASGSWARGAASASPLGLQLSLPQQQPAIGNGSWARGAASTSPFGLKLSIPQQQAEAREWVGERASASPLQLQQHTNTIGLNLMDSPITTHVKSFSCMSPLGSTGGPSIGALARSLISPVEKIISPSEYFV